MSRFEGFKMTSYGNVHRRFLQSFVYQPAKTEAEALEIYRLARVEQEQEISDDLDRFIDTINTTIRRHTTLQIKTIFCDLKGVKYYIASNCTPFKWTSITSLYHKNEQLLFKIILDEIVKSVNGNISTIECLNSSGQANMSKAESNATIKKFVNDNWFTEKRGRLYMGVRGTAELESYISEVYVDIASYCPLCRSLVFWGHRCGACSQTCHFHCLKRYFTSTGSNITCPNCDDQWPDGWENNGESSEESDCEE